MPSFDIPGELIPGHTGYICVICENALIEATETSCGHKFCYYCINLWKRHHNLCPICVRDAGSFTRREDIDDLIERFFSTASTAAREERYNTIKRRNEASNLVFGNPAGSEMRALLDQLKPSPGSDPALSQPPRTAVSGSNDAKKELVRLLSDTDRFQRQLETVYSKILTTGERLTAREDQAVARLCGASVGGYDTPLSTFAEMKKERNGQAGAGRPHTAFSSSAAKNFSGFISTQGTTLIPQMKNDANGHPAKPAKEQAEIDALIELTDDVLRIEDFLKEYSFETLTHAGGEVLGGDDLEDDFDADSIFNDESLKDATNELMSDFDYDSIGSEANFKVHPEVQKYLDRCTFKIHPHIPRTSKNVHGISRPTTPVDETIEPLNGRRRSSTLAKSSSKRDQNLKTSNVDLTNKILQCRASLLNLKQKSETEMVTKLNFKPINYSGIPAEEEEGRAQDEESYKEYRGTFAVNGPMGDTEKTGQLFTSASSSTSATDLEISQQFDEHTIRNIGREPIRPSTRPRQQLHKHPPRPVTTQPPKEFGLGNVTSLPAIPNREKRNGLEQRTRSSTALDPKSLNALRR